MRRALLLLMLAPASAGCLVASLQPIYDSRTLAFDEGLLGTWQAPEDRISVVVERGQWHAYKITYADATLTLALTAYRTNIGGDAFLDLVPFEGLETGQLLIPVHLIVRLRPTPAGFDASLLNYDWFSRADAPGALGPLHTAIDVRQNVLITSSQAATRAWIRAHLKSAQVFGDPMKFVRRPGL